MQSRNYFTLMKMDNLLDFKGVKGLHFIHGNIRSMFNKFDQLKQYLLDSNITFLGLSETWLNENILAACYMFLAISFLDLIVHGLMQKIRLRKVEACVAIQMGIVIFRTQN